MFELRGDGCGPHGVSGAIGEVVGPEVPDIRRFSGAVYTLWEAEGQPRRAPARAALGRRPHHPGRFFFAATRYFP